MDLRQQLIELAVAGLGYPCQGAPEHSGCISCMSRDILDSLGEGHRVPRRLRHDDGPPTGEPEAQGEAWCGFTDVPHEPHLWHEFGGWNCPGVKPSHGGAPNDEIAPTLASDDKPVIIGQTEATIAYQTADGRRRHGVRPYPEA